MGSASTVPVHSRTVPGIALALRRRVAFRGARAFARRASSSRPDGTHCRGHVLGIRKSPPFLFNDLRVIDPDGEFARATDDQLGVHAEVLLQLGCHPGSARAIPSGVAVADHHLHLTKRSTAAAGHADPDGTALARAW